MGQALRDIQQVYDEKLDATRNDVETYYNLKVSSRAFSCLIHLCLTVYAFCVFFTLHIHSEPLNLRSKVCTQLR